MKNYFTPLLLVVALLLSLSANAQVNRANTKKSSAYKGNLQRISATCDDNHAAEIRKGTLWTWGYNYYGQLGDGTTTNRSSHVQVGTDNKWVMVHPGFVSHGIKSDGTLWGWGFNGEGAVGDGTTTDRHTPVQVGTDTKWISVVGGERHVLALKSDGTLWGWGYNSHGMIGDGTTTQRNTPVQIGTDNKWISIATGHYHSLGLKSDGTIWAWGYNASGQLGDGTVAKSYTPIQVGTDNKWVAITAGSEFSAGLKSDGTIWGWGNNGAGVVGDGTTTLRYTPVQAGTDNKWVSISGGAGHNIALKSDGTIWGWGANSHGMLGDGSTTDRYSPVQIGTDDKWVSVETGYNFSFGEKSDGSLWAWGQNNYGQLGDGTTTDRHSPVQIRTDSQWVNVAGGSEHSLALRSDGKLWGWGYNANGQLGDGTNVQRYNPVRVGTDNKWVSSVAGSNFSLGLKSNGTIWAWGNNANGQLGDGTTTQKNSPVQTGSDTKWVSISAGDDHSMGLKSDGTIWAWGNNSKGQLGDGTTTQRSSPVQTGSDNKWVSIIAGHACSFGLKSDGTLWAWGWNGNGQLGDGTTTDRNSPVQIGTDNKWVRISSGGTHTLGLKSNGTLWAWGNNSYGEIGDGTTVQRSSPVQVGSDDKWIYITAGLSHSMGLKSDGTLWGWGRNLKGELGDGSTTQRSSPVQIGSNVNWVDISAGDYHSLGLRSERTRFCATGSNSRAQLADGTTTDKTSFICNNTYCSEPPAPVSSNQTICSGKTAKLTAYGSGTMNWYSAATGGNYLGGVTTAGVSEFTTPALTANTTYYVQDSTCGLSATRTAVSVKVNSLPVVSATASASTVCAGATVTLKGNGANWYVWSGGITDGVGFVPSSTGTYIVIGTDTNNCSDTALAIVTVNTLPVVSANANFNTVCAGTSVILTGAGAGTYTWTGGVANGISFVPASTNTFIVTGTDANSCTDTAAITITVNPLPVVTANASATTVCAGFPVTLTGGGASTFMWTGGVTNGLSFIPSTTTTYIVAGTDNKNCIDTAQIKITVNPRPVVSANPGATTVCAGTAITLTGGGANFYTWTGGVTNGLGFVPAATNTYVVTGTDLNNCTDTATATVIVNQLPIVTANASATTVCAGTSVNLTGGGAASYTWTGGIFNGVDFVPVSTTTYIVTGTDGNNCSDTAAINVAVNSRPVVSASASATVVCAGTQVTLTGHGAPAYTWTGGVINGIAFVPSSTNSYIVTGTNANSCSDTALIQITVNPLPAVTANASATNVCEGTVVTLTGTGALNYSWTDGVTDGVGFIPLATNTYTVTGTDGNNCSGAASKTIAVKPMPVITTFLVGATIISNQTGATYQWLNCSNNFSPIGGAINQSYTATASGDYAVSVSMNSCSDTSDCVTITLTAIEVAAKNSQRFNIYPNPAAGIFNVQASEAGHYSIINALGQIIQQFELNESNNYNVPVENLGSGVYFVVALNNNHLSRQKVIVTK